MRKDKTATLTYTEGLSTVGTFAGEYATHKLLPFATLLLNRIQNAKFEVRPFDDSTP